MIQISGRTAFIGALLFAGLLVFAYRSGNSRPEAAIGNPPSVPASPAESPDHYFSLQQHGIAADTVQVIKSLLGVEVKFFKGNIDYAAKNLIGDARYEALGEGEKLVDAIQFQPLHSSTSLLLVAIARTPAGPRGVPGKFDIVRRTDRGGLILKDPGGRLFYYTGYIVATPEWQGLFPGQSLQDSFCKNLDQMAFCTTQNAVSITLTKPPSPAKDIPVLGVLK